MRSTCARPPAIYDVRMRRMAKCPGMLHSRLLCSAHANLRASERTDRANGRPVIAAGIPGAAAPPPPPPAACPQPAGRAPHFPPWLSMRARAHIRPPTDCVSVCNRRSSEGRPPDCYPRHAITRTHAGTPPMMQYHRLVVSRRTRAHERSRAIESNSWP